MNYQNKQYPAVIVQTSEETREDQELGVVQKQDTELLILLYSGFVKGAESNIDTLRND